MTLVHSSLYVGVMIDESLDISVTEQMVVYYRIVGPDGKSKTVFAGVEELGAGDAETICAALLGRLSRDGVRHEVLMCFGVTALL